jgi:hypothetical protein
MRALTAASVAYSEFTVIIPSGCLRLSVFQGPVISNVEGIAREDGHREIRQEMQRLRLQ